MPVQHIVALKFKKDLTEERIKAHFEDEVALKRRMPWLVQSWTWSKNISLGLGSYTGMEVNHGMQYVVQATFDDEDALKEFLDHPQYREVAEVQVPLLEDKRTFVVDTVGPSLTAVGAAGGAGGGGSPDVAKWGIMSTAEIATKSVAAMHASPYAKVVAVASRSLEKAAAWAKEHGVPRALGSYEELINDEEVQVIYIPLPTALKTGWALKAAKAGKHIVLEKPLPGMEDTAELESIVKACADNGVQFFDGSMWQHSKRSKIVKSRIEAGDFGETRRIEAAFTFAAPSEEWLNGGNGRTDKTREPMGCFGDQGWYPISAVLFCVDYELPERVQSISVTKNTVDTIVAGAAVLWWRDGKYATIEYGCTSSHRSYFSYAGSTGALTIEDLVGGQGKTGNFGAYFGAFTGSDYYKEDDVMGKETIVKVPASDHTEELVSDMSKIALSGKLEDRWPKAALATHSVMLAVFRSAEAGGTVVSL